jgi:hypothetical protein
MNRFLEFASPRVPRKRNEGSPLSDYTDVDATTQVGTERSEQSPQSHSQGANSDAPKRSSDRIRENKSHRSSSRRQEDGEEDRNGIDSDLDEQLTEFDDSDMDSLAGGDGEVDPTNLVRLTEESCRAPCKIKVLGNIVPSICGRRADVCKRHLAKRDQGGRQSIGYYARVEGAGGQVHGKLGNVFLSESQMEERLMKDRREMGDHLRDQEDDLDEEGELETLRRLQELRQDTEPSQPLPKNVAFGSEETRAFPTPPSLTNPQPPPPQLRADDPRRLEIPFRGLSVRTKAKEQVERNDVWVGMLDESGLRQIVTGLQRALVFVNDHHWTLVRTFTSMEESDDWAYQSPDSQVQLPSPPRRARPQLSSQPAARQRDYGGKPPSYRRPSKPVDSYPDSRKGPQSHERTKESKKDRQRKKKRDKRRRRRSPSSSSSSSSSASSSSTSDGSHYRGRKASRRKEQSSDSEQESRQNGRRQRRGLSSKIQPVNTAGADVSKGLKNYAFEKDVTGTEIDRVIGPEGMSMKDSDQLYSLAVDVASLPGMYIARDDNRVDEDAEATRTTQMAATLLSTAVHKRETIHDSLWKTRARHGLREARDEASFFELVQSVDKAERHAFEHQEISLRSLLAKRHYDQRSVDSYIQHGLLIRLTKDTFRWYKDLLNRARELQYRHNGTWEGGPAQSMISLHSKELWAIRNYAPTKKLLILRTYTYLRDAKEKSFYDDSMNESLWDRYAALAKDFKDSAAKPAAEGKLKPVKGAAVACSHCKSKRLHTLYGAAPFRRTCPLRVQNEALAKQIAGVITKKHEEDPTVDINDIKNDVVANWS